MAYTEAKAIFCFSPPEREKIFLPRRFSIFRSFAAVATFSTIRSLGNARFSKPKAISLSVSTLKNCVLGF